jgi:hypothetical protein
MSVAPVRDQTAAAKQATAAITGGLSALDCPGDRIVIA